MGQLFWKTDASLKFGSILYSSFGINIYDTFNELNNPSGSTIPHVRSDIQDYKEGKILNQVAASILNYHTKMCLCELT